MQTARLNLEYTAIRAPIDGRTGDLLVHAGNLVKPDADTAMVVINQVHPMYVDFAIPEQKLPAVREFMAEHKLAVQVSLPEQQGPLESGELSFVDNSVDAKTGTINLKGQFTNADGRLWPGEFVNTTLVLHEHPGAILVPSQAVQTGQQGSFVFVVQPNMKAEIRPVVIGQSIDNQTVVTSGLKPGETVVTDGQLRLIPGATVTIKSGLNDERRRLMNIAEAFIRRPVMTTLSSLAIVLFGLMAYRYLPVNDLPNVDFPTIVVSASLPGASPETMASSVATPLEKQFSTIAGLDSMTSTNIQGSTNITLQFNLTRNIDAGAQDVQAAIAADASRNCRRGCRVRRRITKLIRRISRSSTSA